MTYDFIAIPDQDVPRATDPLFQHLVVTYVSETNKTASMWRAIPDDLLDFKPHEKVNTIRAILVHQILSERRFFAQLVGTEEPPVEELLPPAISPRCKPTWTSTSCWRNGDCLNLPKQVPSGG
ncbi:MAG: hypothetical protein ABSE84_09240 [Isosphaeraceae bacterium]|jgi:hypothetical protein